jgi:hypothetical protein
MTATGSVGRQKQRSRGGGGRGGNPATSLRGVEEVDDEQEVGDGRLHAGRISNRHKDDDAPVNEDVEEADWAEAGLMTGGATLRSGKGNARVSTAVIWRRRSTAIG